MTDEQVGIIVAQAIKNVREHYKYECRKHDLHPDPEEYAREKIDEMTNSELLDALYIQFA